MKQSYDNHFMSIPRQMDVLLDGDDVIEFRIYNSASSLRNFVVDVNGITILRVAGLKEFPQIKDER